MTIDERISRDLRQHLPDVDESGVWQHIETAAIITRRSRRAMIAVASAAAAVAVVAGWITLLTFERALLPVASDPARSDIPTEQMAMIRQVVDALNRRNPDGFVEHFAPEGEFDPWGDLKTTIFDNSQPVSDEDRLAVWMTILETWGLEADLSMCRTRGRGEFVGGPSVGCEVATRWRTLSVEISEEWLFEFRGTQLIFWDHRLVDLEPDDRTLPFGYDLIEEWEAWLEATDPLAASRYLSRRTWDVGCDGCQEAQDALAPGNPELAARLAPLVHGNSEEKWKVDGYLWWPDGLIPYDPNLADEIEASINEYLEAK